MAGKLEQEPGRGLCAESVQHEFTILQSFIESKESLI